MKTQRHYGDYVLTTTWTPGGQLHRHRLNHSQLNRDYTWNSVGHLVRISGQHEEHEYAYGAAGRLHITHIRSAHPALTRQTRTDPAGNRLTTRGDAPGLPDIWPDNRIGQDADYVYHYDDNGRLTAKDERRLRSQGALSHLYGYDNQHRLVHYRQVQNGNLLVESRYLYDPLGRRIGKRVWKSQAADNDGPAVTWYGWDGDRLTTTQTDKSRIQTVYLPGSFTPLLRTETPTAELTKMQRRTLAEKLQQEANTVFMPELVAQLDKLEQELRTDRVSDPSRQWLTQCGLTPEQMKNQMEPDHTPQRKIHLFHCDHRGLPLALFNENGKTAWRAGFDEWGNRLWEENPDNLQQLIRLPGQQWDEESGLCYNRHRYYDPAQGRYITQDPIGLREQLCLSVGSYHLY